MTQPAASSAAAATELTPFVDWAWVQAHPDAVLADVRWELLKGPKRDDYLAGHLPGAVFVDIDTDLSDPPSPERGRHPLPDPIRFAERMGELGIDGSRPVIAYDDAGGLFAARLAWMLRALGHPAAVLDGGIDAALSADETLELATGEAEVTPVTFRPALIPSWLLAEMDEVADLDDETVLIDARSRERYLGNDNTDARAGHIPGAKSVPVLEHIRDGSLKPESELLPVFANAGISPGTPVVSYCGSGVTGTHNLLVLEQLGLGVGRLYPGSFSQWAADPTREVEQ